MRQETDSVSSSTSSSSTPSGNFTRLSAGERSGALLATCALLGFVVVADDFPAVRLAILTYMVWAMGEWLVHRWVGVSLCHRARLSCRMSA